MGKNILASTPLARQVIDELMRIGDGLPQSGRLALRKFSEHILNHRAAIASAPNLGPVEAALLVLLIVEHEKNNRIDNELFSRLESLEDKLALLIVEMQADAEADERI